MYHGDSAAPPGSTVGEPSPPLSPKGKEGVAAKPGEGAYVEGTTLREQWPSDKAHSHFALNIL